MSFQLERHNILRREVRRGYAANAIQFYPKEVGVGSVTLSAAPTYEIKSPAGALLASGTAALGTDGDDAISIVTITIDASNTETFRLAENYMCIVSWVYASITHVDTLRFDVVLEPFYPRIALNDLALEYADIEEDLDRQAAAIDPQAGLTGAQLASVYGMKGWADVRRKVRALLTGQGRIYPRLVIDREGLRYVAAAAAMHHFYKAEGGGIDTETGDRAAEWLREADARLVSLGELAYDADEDRVEDATRSAFGTVQTHRATTGSPRRAGLGVNALN